VLLSHGAGNPVCAPNASPQARLVQPLGASRTGIALAATGGAHAHTLASSLQIYTVQ
jgi:hypothetical protein